MEEIKLEEIQEAIKFIEKRRNFLRTDGPNSEERYEKVMMELAKVISDNKLGKSETNDFFYLACALNSIKHMDTQGITSSPIVLENRNR